MSKTFSSYVSKDACMETDEKKNYNYLLCTFPEKQKRTRSAVIQKLGTTDYITIWKEITILKKIKHFDISSRKLVFNLAAAGVLDVLVVTIKAESAMAQLGWLCNRTTWPVA